MTRPALKIESKVDVARAAEKGTLMLLQDGDPTPCIVQITDLTGAESGTFKGVDITSGTYGETWERSDFVFFEGSITLSA